MTAEVDGLGGGAPTGQVAFADGATALGSAKLFAPGAGQTTLALGWGQSCALSSAGGVTCWGPKLVTMPGLSRGVISISGPASHSCALTAAGGAKCWGLNGRGQLGYPFNEDHREPVDVPGMTSGLVAVQAGYDHTCALTALGGVKCWGDNQSGQLGDGTMSPSYKPVDVLGLQRGVVAITTGRSTSCALTAYGVVKCWGSYVGNGTWTPTPTPVVVAGLGRVRSLSAGSGFTCVVTDSGGVKCWGVNSNGQLGDGTTTTRLTPVAVEGLESGVVAVSAGDMHSCALTGAGGVKCWGARSRGQLGDGMASLQPARAPVQVAGLESGAVAVGAGHEHSCAKLADGSVKCWGDNLYGQLGDGTAGYSHTPVFVAGLRSGVAAVTAGASHACALTASQGVKCWGNNSVGQVGDGTTQNRVTPVDVLPSGVAQIVAGDGHNCARLVTGEVNCWGANTVGQLGDGTRIQRNSPTRVPALNLVVRLALGAGHSCALDGAGGVKCWGSSAYGQIGDGQAGQRLTPVGVDGLYSGVVDIVAGAQHSCALLKTGEVKCWGANNYGQLGGDAGMAQATPHTVRGVPAGIIALTAGGYHTCALTSGGAVSCWGRNDNGEAGNGVLRQRQWPVTPIGLSSGVARITAGHHRTCALMKTGEVRCWGSDYYAAFGDGKLVQRLRPQKIDTLSNVTAFSLGDAVSCAVRFGAAQCWGRNDNGQLGDGTPTLRITPVTTLGFAGLMRARAQLPVSFSGAGAHTLRANYDGDATHGGSMGVSVHWVLQ